MRMDGVDVIIVPSKKLGQLDSREYFYRWSGRDSRGGVKLSGPIGLRAVQQCPFAKDEAIAVGK